MNRDLPSAEEEFFARLRRCTWPSSPRRLGQVDRAIEVLSDVNDCDPRRLPRPVFKGNSRSVSVVILLSLSYPAVRSRGLPGVPARNYRRIYKERRIYKPAKSGLSCSPRRVLESLESTEKADHRERAAEYARKKRSLRRRGTTIQRRSVVSEQEATVTTAESPVRCSAGSEKRYAVPTTAQSFVAIVAESLRTARN